MEKFISESGEDLKFEEKYFEEPSIELKNNLELLADAKIDFNSLSENLKISIAVNGGLLSILGDFPVDVKR